MKNNYCTENDTSTKKTQKLLDSWLSSRPLLGWEASKPHVLVPKLFLKKGVWVLWFLLPGFPEQKPWSLACSDFLRTGGPLPFLGFPRLITQVFHPFPHVPFRLWTVCQGYSRLQLLQVSALSKTCYDNVSKPSTAPAHSRTNVLHLTCDR